MSSYDFYYGEDRDDPRHLRHGATGSTGYAGGGGGGESGGGGRRGGGGGGRRPSLTRQNSVQQQRPSLQRRNSNSSFGGGGGGGANRRRPSLGDASYGSQSSSFRATQRIVMGGGVGATPSSQSRGRRESCQSSVSSAESRSSVGSRRRNRHGRGGGAGGGGGAGTGAGGGAGTGGRGVYRENSASTAGTGEASYARAIQKASGCRVVGGGRVSDNSSFDSENDDDDDGRWRRGGKRGGGGGDDDDDSITSSSSSSEDDDYRSRSGRRGREHGGRGGGDGGGGGRRRRRRRRGDGSSQSSSVRSSRDDGGSSNKRLDRNRRRDRDRHHDRKRDHRHGDEEGDRHHRVRDRRRDDHHHHHHQHHRDHGQGPGGDGFSRASSFGGSTGLSDEGREVDVKSLLNSDDDDESNNGSNDSGSSRSRIISIGTGLCDNDDDDDDDDNKSASITSSLSDGEEEEDNDSNSDSESNKSNNSTKKKQVKEAAPDPFDVMIMSSSESDSDEEDRRTKSSFGDRLGSGGDSALYEAFPSNRGGFGNDHIEDAVNGGGGGGGTGGSGDHHAGGGGGGGEKQPMNVALTKRQVMIIERRKEREEVMESADEHVLRPWRKSLETTTTGKIASDGTKAAAAAAGGVGLGGVGGGTTTTTAAAAAAAEDGGGGGGGGGVGRKSHHHHHHHESPSPHRGGGGGGGMRGDGKMSPSVAFAAGIPHPFHNSADLSVFSQSEASYSQYSHGGDTHDGRISMGSGWKPSCNLNELEEEVIIGKTDSGRSLLPPESQQALQALVVDSRLEEEQHIQNLFAPPGGGGGGGGGGDDVLELDEEAHHHHRSHPHGQRRISEERLIQLNNTEGGGDDGGGNVDDDMGLVTQTSSSSRSPSPLRPKKGGPSEEALQAAKLFAGISESGDDDDMDENDKKKNDETIMKTPKVQNNKKPSATSNSANVKVSGATATSSAWNNSIISSGRSVFDTSGRSFFNNSESNFNEDGGNGGGGSWTKPKALGISPLDSAQLKEDQMGLLDDMEALVTKGRSDYGGGGGGGGENDENGLGGGSFDRSSKRMGGGLLHNNNVDDEYSDSGRHGPFKSSKRNLAVGEERRMGMATDGSRSTISGGGGGGGGLGRRSHDEDDAGGGGGGGRGRGVSGRSDGGASSGGGSSSFLSFRSFNRSSSKDGSFIGGLLCGNCCGSGKKAVVIIITSASILIAAICVGLYVGLKPPPTEDNDPPSSKPSTPPSLPELTAPWEQVGSSINGQNAGDTAGSSVSLSSSGLRLAVGSARSNAGGYDDTGNVRIFQLGSRGDWSQVGNDIPGNQAREFSGYSISLSGDGKRIAIGSRFHSNLYGVRSGRTRVFELQLGTWEQLGDDIMGTSDGDEAGFSVCLSEDGRRLAIGAWKSDGISNGGAGGGGVENGSVRVFEYTERNWGDPWTLLGDVITGENEGDWFGMSVSLSRHGNWLAVGAPKNSDNGLDSGNTRIFEYDIGNGWIQRGQIILGKDAGGWAGRAVSLSKQGETVAIGAFRSDIGGMDSGVVRVYQFDGKELLWNQIGSDIVGVAQSQLGGSIALSEYGDRLVVGADRYPLRVEDGGGGKVEEAGMVTSYIYVNNDWQQIGQQITGNRYQDRAGNAVSLSSDGTFLSMGIYGSDDRGPNSGQARVYAHPS